MERKIKTITKGNSKHIFLNSKKDNNVLIINSNGKFKDKHRFARKL